VSPARKGGATYAKRLLDRIFVVAAEQTANVRPNPDDANYPDVRAAAAKATAWAIFKARNEMQQDRRDAEAREKKKRAREGAEQ
jgi:hypothetical protein